MHVCPNPIIREVETRTSSNAESQRVPQRTTEPPARCPATVVRPRVAEQASKQSTRTILGYEPDAQAPAAAPTEGGIAH